MGSVSFTELARPTIKPAKRFYILDEPTTASHLTRSRHAARLRPPPLADLGNTVRRSIGTILRSSRTGRLAGSTWPPAAGGPTVRNRCAVPAPRRVAGGRDRKPQPTAESFRGFPRPLARRARAPQRFSTPRPRGRFSPLSRVKKEARASPEQADRSRGEEAAVEAPTGPPLGTPRKTGTRRTSNLSRLPALTASIPLLDHRERASVYLSKKKKRKRLSAFSDD